LFVHLLITGEIDRYGEEGLSSEEIEREIAQQFEILRKFGLGSSRGAKADSQN
jgi:hypothetical protein